LNQFDATVISNTRFFPGIKGPAKTITGTNLLWLDCPRIAAEARPGQFVMVRCGNLPLPRPFSVHQVSGGKLALLFSVLEDGQGTGWLARCQPAEVLRVFGPLGNGFTYGKSVKKLLLVAGGMGIAPLYFAACEAIGRDIEVTILVGAKTATQVYPPDLFPGGIKVQIATDDGSAGEKSMVTALIPHHAGKAGLVLACGPLPMYRYMAERRKTLGLDGVTVQVSLETTMACGHGVCYGCTIRTKQGLRQVCRDGPVFDMDDILWPEMTG
jgi:dihydroorotate dehydrogenase electron transfer subunit